MADEAAKTEEQTTETTEKVEPATAAEQKPGTETKPEPTLLEKSKPVMVNADGTFSDNWTDMLPEELKAEAEGLKIYKDVPNLVKGTLNARKLVGKDKVAVPNEKSKPEEWDAFFNAIGRPETADGYKFDVPEDFQEIFTDERMKSAKELAHNLGITASQFEAYMQHEVEAAERLLEQDDELEARAKLEAKQNAEQTLRQEFGGAYDKYMAAANRLINEAIPNEEENLAFVEEFGNNPKFVRFAAIVGSRLSESKGIVAQLTQDTPKEARKKINELLNTPGYLAPYHDEKTGKMVEMPDDQRQAIMEQIRELEKQINPEAAKHNAFVGSV